MNQPGDFHLFFGGLGPLVDPSTHFPLRHVAWPTATWAGHLGGPGNGGLILLLLLLLPLLLLLEVGQVVSRNVLGRVRCLERLPGNNGKVF